MTTLQQRRASTSMRWHHPRVHLRREGWVWECPCGAAGRASEEAAWRRALVAARRHADQATG